MSTNSWGEQLLSALETLHASKLTSWLYGIGFISIFFFFFSILLSLWLIERLPSDYFLKWHKNTYGLRHQHWSMRLLTYLLRNTLALILFLSGVAMLFLPGQGLLTILLALVISDTRYKRRLLDKLISKPKIQASLNWVRRKKKRQLFKFPKSDAS